MPVPARSIRDHFAELVCVLGLVAGTCGKIGREIYTLMKTEYGEVEEPVPAGTVGSSTMPHKRNPQLYQDVLSITAEIRSLVPLALEAMQSEHEADHSAPEPSSKRSRGHPFSPVTSWNAFTSSMPDYG